MDFGQPFSRLDDFLMKLYEGKRSFFFSGARVSNRHWNIRRARHSRNCRKLLYATELIPQILLPRKSDTNTSVEFLESQQALFETRLCHS